MEVKVFMEEQKQKLVTEPDEWAKEVEELGLVGQKAFCPKTEANPDAPSSVIPFPRMTNEMMTVYRELLPDQGRVQSYAGDPIPTKVLEVIRFVRKEGYFSGPSDEIQVWHKFGSPDPLLIGKKYMPGPDHYYLLAQWGIEIPPFETARQEFIDIWQIKLKAKAEETTIKARRLIENAAARTAAIMEMLREGKTDIDIEDIPF